MFKIGDFSKLSQVSVKTLRYYDEIGLLKPVEIDRFTGYRYYVACQLSRLNRILALKDLGLSLEQIGGMLHEELPASQLRGMLRLKQAEIEHSIVEEQARLARVAARLSQIELEESMANYDVIIKKIAPLRVASVRAVIPTPDQQAALWGELEGYLAQNKVMPSGPCLTLYHDVEYKDHDVDAEVCEPIAATLPAQEPVKVSDLPGVETMACTVHHGSFDSLGQAYTAIMKWIEASGYRIVGPNREIYLQTGEPVRQDDPSYVTEIQFPVEKM